MKITPNTQGLTLLFYTWAALFFFAKFILVKASSSRVHSLDHCLSLPHHFPLRDLVCALPTSQAAPCSSNSLIRESVSITPCQHHWRSKRDRGEAASPDDYIPEGEWSGSMVLHPFKNYLYNLSPSTYFFSPFVMEWKVRHEVRVGLLTALFSVLLLCGKLSLTLTNDNRTFIKKSKFYVLQLWF